MDPVKRLQKKSPQRRQSPTVIGLPRNQFGTRLSQRVECEKCHKVDYVPIRVSQAKAKFCRDCAEKYLSTYEAGRVVEEEKVTCVCDQCRRDFPMSLELSRKKEQLLCADCFRGFDVWRGKSAATQKKTLTKIGSLTTFRKVTNESI